MKLQALLANVDTAIELLTTQVVALRAEIGKGEPIAPTVPDVTTRHTGATREQTAVEILDSRRHNGAGWTVADELLLREKYASDGDIVGLAARMGRTVGSLRARASLIGICRPRRPADAGSSRVASGRGPRMHWTDEEVQQLRTEFPSGDIFALADDLKRTVAAVLQRAKSEGIERDPRAINPLFGADDAHPRTVGQITEGGAS